MAINAPKSENPLRQQRAFVINMEKVYEVTNLILHNLNYDPLTGLFTRAYGRKKVGWINSDGYLTINCNRKTRTAHRWAWFIFYGEWPRLQIDHINGNKLDNRIENLREVDGQMNAQNQRSAMSTNKVGILGVTESRGKFRADIYANGKSIFLGRYENKEDAKLAYVTAKRNLHRGCTI